MFPLDSRAAHPGRPFGTAQVPSRVNSPADVEIDAATRDGSLGTLSFAASLLNGSFSVTNTVVNGINLPTMTRSEGPATGEEVQITITFTPPILLPAGHYFFRPEVLVDDGDFLYLSAPRPIVAPGTPFRRGPASLDPQLGLGAGLAANRHRHHRRRHPGPRST